MKGKATLLQAGAGVGKDARIVNRK